MRLFPDTIFMLSPPLLRIFHSTLRGNAPSIDIALPPSAREAVLSIYAYAFEHDMERVEEFKQILTDIFGNHSNELEKAGMWGLLDALALVMKERQHGFFWQSLQGYTHSPGCSKSLE